VPLRREHRLYHADWLMRFYGFTADEITEDDDQLDLELDPKCAWAVRHPEQFPVEVNTADLATLLRVPGVGVKSARRILAARRARRLDVEDVRRLGVVVKRAVFFLTFGGRFYGLKSDSRALLRAQLGDGPAVGGQMTLEECVPRISVPAALPAVGAAG
jgi:predicted DNA-binding helix-hairpin-helix protein